jgi:Barstar (barnase inhibitor)
MKPDSINNLEIINSAKPFALVKSRERDMDMLFNSSTGMPTNDTTTRFIRGSRCKTYAHLLQEFAAALQFPYYFGENWAAFDECVNDLSWLPAKKYVIVITNTNLVLSQEGGKAFNLLEQTLRDTAKRWISGENSLPVRGDGKEPADFSVIFHVEESKNIPEALKVDKNIPMYNIHPLDAIN